MNALGTIPGVHPELSIAIMLSCGLLRGATFCERSADVLFTVWRAGLLITAPPTHPRRARAERGCVGVNTVKTVRGAVERGARFFF